MLETDAPFMHPESEGQLPKGRRREKCEPMHTAYVAAVVARALGVTVPGVAAATTRNAVGYFGL
jgi:Tat protein secretion system quality control protein TatD with DNase activity